MLLWLIDVMLRGVSCDYPVKTEDDENAALQAWAAAGNASLI
jgi:hypothetical protein